ncbi:MAG: hypothetical protein P4M01_12405 [Acidobacteriota bacterium]|nr:hypothetical protein [Acidobacteriota bacterium]
MKFTHLMLKILFVLAVVPGVSYADTVINFASSGGNGITLTKETGGEYLTFSNLYVGSGSIGGTSYSSDSAIGSAVTLSAGSGGHFFLDSVSSDGLTGYFASNSTATITIGNASSGYLTGTLSLIELDTNTTSKYPSGHGSFSLSLTLTNMSYTCGTGCTYSTLLSTFAATGNGTNNAYNTITFTFNGTTNVSSLLSVTSSGTTAAGSLDSYYDTVTPEPASLALFGSCLLAAGMKFRGKAKAAE